MPDIYGLDRKLKLGGLYDVNLPSSIIDASVLTYSSDTNKWGVGIGGGGGGLPPGTIDQHLIHDGASYVSTNEVRMGLGSGSGGVASVSLGLNSGQTNQGNFTISIGANAGKDNQELNCIAIGEDAGKFNQKEFAVAIGYASGDVNQKAEAVAIGDSSGSTNQGEASCAFGFSAGQDDQGDFAVAVGMDAGLTSQGTNSIAIGNTAGETSQGIDSICIGRVTSALTEGIAIGSQAVANTGISIGAGATNTTGISIGHGVTAPTSGIELATTQTSLIIERDVGTVPVFLSSPDGISFKSHSLKDLYPSADPAEGGDMIFYDYRTDAWNVQGVDTIAVGRLSNWNNSVGAKRNTFYGRATAYDPLYISSPGDSATIGQEMILIGTSCGNLGGAVNSVLSDFSVGIGNLCYTRGSGYGSVAIGSRSQQLQSGDNSVSVGGFCGTLTGERAICLGSEIGFIDNVSGHLMADDTVTIGSKIQAPTNAGSILIKASSTPYAVTDVPSTIRLKSQTVDFGVTPQTSGNYVMATADGLNWTPKIVQPIYGGITFDGSGSTVLALTTTPINMSQVMKTSTVNTPEIVYDNSDGSSYIEVAGTYNLSIEINGATDSGSDVIVQAEIKLSGAGSYTLLGNSLIQSYQNPNKFNVLGLVDIVPLPGDCNIRVVIATVSGTTNITINNLGLTATRIDR